MNRRAAAVAHLATFSLRIGCGNFAANASGRGQFIPRLEHDTAKRFVSAVFVRQLMDNRERRSGQEGAGNTLLLFQDRSSARHRTVAFHKKRRPPEPRTAIALTTAGNSEESADHSRYRFGE